MHMWSDTKKKLESFLCSSLNGRVEYFCTMYREAHDGSGRACITVDNIEVINCSLVNFIGKVNDPKSGYARGEFKSDYVYRERQFTPWTGENQETGDKVYSIEAFFEAVGLLFDSPISVSLNHFNDIAVCLALVDRRTGKRTLKKMKDDIEKRCNLVKFFYELRYNAEFKDAGINS